MPKIHDLCQVFWEELLESVPIIYQKSIVPNSDCHSEQFCSYEKIVEIVCAEIVPAYNNKTIRQHLLLLGYEMKIQQLLSISKAIELAQNFFGLNPSGSSTLD